MVRLFPKVARFLAVVCFVFLPFGLLAQMVPPILNFTPDTYKAENQNWGISQGTDGRMYFANNAGLLEFTGEDWKRYPSSNGSITRSVLAHGERVYTGSYMDFGYWMRDEFGQMNYHSLSEQLKESLLEDEQFWNIQFVKDWVLFQSLERIYAYHISEDRFEIIPSDASRARLFTSNEEIYFVREGFLMTLSNGKAEQLANLQPDGWELVGMTRLGGRQVFIAEDATLLEVQGERLAALKPLLTRFLPSPKIYCVLGLRDGGIALGTISQGLFILSEDGELLFHLNKENGLNNNTVLSLSEDRDGNLWIGLDNGISVVNRSSAFREYNDTAGLLGEVYTAAVHKGRLYVGTNQGLFYAGYPTVENFEFVPGTEGQVWKLKEIGGALFCGHNKGTFLIEDSQARLISDLPGTWDFKIVPGTDSLLLQGHYQGLSLLARRQGKWILRNMLEDYDISSRFFEFTGPHHLIVNHEYKGIYTLKLNDAMDRVAIEAQQPPLGIGASLFRFGGNLNYATDEAVYFLEESSGTFVKDSVMTLGLKRNEDMPFGVLLPDHPAGRLWGFGNGSIHYVEVGHIDQKPEFNKIHVPISFRANMGVLGFECLANLGNEQYLIGRSNGFVILNLKGLDDFLHNPAITGVRKELLGQTPAPVALAGPAELDFAYSSFWIDYSVPSYNKFKEVQYQYRLEGFQDAWSAWSTNSSAVFSNLPYGKYKFEVRARVGDLVSEEAAVFPFSIAPPWYLTPWAKAIYFLLLLMLLYGVHLIYRGYYRGKQKKIIAENKSRAKREALKTEKRIAEALSEKLQQEIENKNRELAISTMSLIKKNEFLNTLKSSLKHAKGPSDIQSVVKIIDRNIGSEDDWKFFEEAFNNADKGFLKNLREKHADLTPSDLRLCAYLRLNLSSKEIAPLLNISLRSVEVKRYRLRKKLNLSHEESLSDYILGFQKAS